MQNNQRNQSSSEQGGETENHRVGRELYNRDQQRHQPNQHQSSPSGSNWNNGNNFHTGYSNQSRSHFPEDQYGRNSNADLGGSMNKHYGDREHSVYRNPNNLDYGDGRGHGTQQHSHQRPSNQQNYSAFGDGRGNYNARQDSYGHGHTRAHGEDVPMQRRMDDSNENYYRGAYMDSRGVQQELPRPDANPYNEYPGTRSRYKDDDYRYGSGNHSWYEERRYTDNNGRRADRDKGDVLGEMGAGAREVWQDMKHGVQNLWNRGTNHNNDHDRDQRSGNHSNEYRSSRDQGMERGPRWSDETDSGDDSFFYNKGNNPRYY